jgi:RNA polymerase sigma-70 factor, ECF subfamily
MCTGPVVIANCAKGVEDATDIEKVLAGDISAFERVVHRWQGPLRSLAYRFFHDSNRAEEMTQEALLRAYCALGQWRKEASFGTWLYALASNVYRADLRRVRACVVRLEDVPEPRDLRLPDRKLDLEERNQILRNAVLSLPANYRDVLVLYYYCDHNIAMIQLSLGLSQGSVKTRLQRGRAILRKKLSSVSHLCSADHRSPQSTLDLVS